MRAVAVSDVDVDKDGEGGKGGIFGYGTYLATYG